RRTQPARIVVALALLVAIPLPAAAQKAKAPAAAGFAALDAYVAKSMKEWKVPGIALAIVKDDSIVYAKGYGTRTVGKQEPVDANTIFAIGSASKAFTAALVAMAVDEGKMKWDERVSAYLPGFQLYDTYASRDLTMRDALSHRSGLARGDFMWYAGGFSRDEILRRVRYLKPSWGFRSTFGYQNVMLLAAGEAVARAEQQSWDDQVRTKIFAPLGMTASSTSIRDFAGQGNLATPHGEVDDTVVAIPWKNIDNIGPAGSINSNVRDMAQWLRLQLGHGKYGTQQLMTTGAHDEMWQPNIHIRMEGPLAHYLAPGANLAAYGMGWFLQDFDGRLAVHHGGNIDGMSAMVAMLPDEQLGVVILTNKNSTPAPEAIFPYVFDLYTRSTPRDWNAEFHKMLDPVLKAAKEAAAAAEKSRVAGTRPSLELATYAGTYNDSMYGDIVIAGGNDGLTVKLGQFNGTLSHWNYDTFQGRMDNPSAGKPLLTFVLGADGKPSEVKVQGFEDATFRHTSPAADTKPGVTLSTSQLHALVGRYKPESVPLDIDVQLIGDALKLTVPGQPTYTLVAESPTRFRMTGPPGMPEGFFVEFETSGGTATGATIIQPAPRPKMKLTKQ
ncbi:MAG: serine hydrolase, partial [Gemmatimonadota bacterium]